MRKTTPTLILATASNARGGAERIIESLHQAPSPGEGWNKKLLVLRNKADIAGLNADLVGFRQLLSAPCQILHTHLFLPGLLARFRKLWDSSFVWIHTVHYADYQSQRLGRLKRFLDRNFIFPAADELIYVSKTAQKNFSLPRTSQVIWNGKNWKEISNPEPHSASVPVLGCVSMLRKEKGIFELLDIFNAFQKKHPGAKLRIAGEGPERKNLELRIRKLRLESSVELCGFLEDLAGFYKSVDILAQPSLSESFGLSVLEAMEHGKPLVASNAGNLRLLLRNRYGVSIPLGENFESRFSLGLEKVWKDLISWQEASRAGAVFWRGSFSAERFHDRHRKIYQKHLRPGVCMIAPLVTHARGGLQQQLFLQTQELARLGYRVFVLQNEDPEFSQKAASWKHVDFLFARQPFPRFMPHTVAVSRIRGLLFILGGFNLIRKNRARIQVCHAHQLYSPTLLGAAVKFFFAKPLVVKVTASGSWGELAQLKKMPFFRLRKILFQAIDRVFALTSSMAEEVLELGIPPEKVQVMPNSVELPKLSASWPGRPESALETDIHLLFVGRLSKEKSVETILEGARLLAVKNKTIQIDIVGGPYAGRDISGELRALAQSLPAHIKVVFHGEKKDVSAFYRQDAFFILPSVSEGMSNALLEALSYGLVCVVSDIAANKFLVRDGQNGILFEQGSALDFSRKIQALLDLRERSEEDFERLKISARQTIEAQFSKEIICRRIDGVYKELLSPRHIKLLRLFSRLNIGGPTLHVVNLSQGLNAHDYATELFVGQVPADEGDMSDYASAQGVSPTLSRFFQPKLHPWRDFVAFCEIYLKILLTRPDIVHTHTFKAGVLGRIAASLARTPVRVHTYHGHLLSGYTRGWKLHVLVAVEKFLGILTHQVVAVSSQVGEDLAHARIVPAEKIKTVELGFRIDLLQEQAARPSTLRRDLNLGPEKILIGIAGRLVPIKNVELFIRAMAPLLSEFPDLHAVILGDGPTRNFLESLPESQSSRLHFVGWKRPLAAEFKDLDLLVCSSKNEGTSVSVIEAVICGLPVLSTHVGGMGDLLGQGQWGDLVALNEDALRAGVREMILALTSPESKKGMALIKRTQDAAQYFQNRFSTDRLLRDLDQIYRDHLGFKKPLKNQNSESDHFNSLRV